MRYQNAMLRGWCSQNQSHTLNLLGKTECTESGTDRKLTEQLNFGNHHQIVSSVKPPSISLIELLLDCSLRLTNLKEL